MNAIDLRFEVGQQILVPVGSCMSVATIEAVEEKDFQSGVDYPATKGIQLRIRYKRSKELGTFTFPIVK